MNREQPNQVPCAADDDGRTCHRPTVMVRPVPLCAPHKAELALAIVPDLLRDQVAAAHRIAATFGQPDLREDLVAEARAIPYHPFLDGDQHGPIVYFIANGGRVKIGFTTNLKNRLASLALRADGVLLALDGGPDLERALHAHFDAYRDGNSEWFELAPDVFRYIAARQGPDPKAELRTGNRSASPVRTRIARPLADVADVYRRLQVATGRTRPTSQALADELGVSRSRGQQLRDAIEAEFADLNLTTDERGENL